MISTAIRLREIYAQSLFELADRQQGVDTVSSDLNILAGIIGQEKDFIKLLDSPYFSTDYKEQLVRRLLSGVAANLTLDFLMVVIRHGRARLLTDIIGRYAELWDAYHGYYHVKVTVPRALEDGQAGYSSRLQCHRRALSPGRVKLQVAVDPDIIGGAIIRCGDKVIDNSIRNRIDVAVKTVMSRIKSRK
jgi:F-type H+-transporting ATPase subunit delta